MNFHHLIAATFLLTLPYGLSLSTAARTDKNEIIKIFSAKTDDPKLVPWKPNRKLSWDDYECAPVRNTEAVASTSTTLGLSYQYKEGTMVYHITCDFSKTRSWGLLKTPYILAHEQGHFDITELFARRLNEALQNYHFNERTFKQDINRIYQDVVKEKEEMQLQYDEETDHSRDHKMQAEWFDRIANLMDATEAFAYYP